MMNVAVIIVTYNNRLQIIDCLKSVAKQSYQNNFQIVVVDNGSTDGTQKIIKENFPQVVLIENENNGYAGGNNIGITWAEKQGYNTFVLLNPDMEVDIDWLKELVNLAEKKDEVGIVQSKVLFFNEKYRVNTVGNPLHFAGFSWSGGFKNLSSRYLEPKPIVSASGSSLLIKKQVIDKIGYFDENFFMYHEDVDFSWRARLAGYEIYLAPLSKAFHKYTFSFGTKKFYYAERNRLAVVFTHYKFLTLVLLLPFLIFTEIAMLVYAIFTGWTKYKLFSWGGFLLMIPQILIKRFKQNKFRMLSDSKILNLMTDKLDFEALQSPFINYLYNPLAKVYFVLLKLIVKW